MATESDDGLHRPGVQLVIFRVDVSKAFSRAGQTFGVNSLDNPTEALRVSFVVQCPYQTR
ncbi:hypothetical protein [Streptomyces sp. NPDC048111]|uniref:hypothetical protein n=1 Tax=Streptomyces sp. NPDC048111 TaxID=3365500 RepID=UPI00371C48BD